MPREARIDLPVTALLLDGVAWLVYSGELVSMALPAVLFWSKTLNPYKFGSEIELC